ncbi:MAG: sulfurtransferase, partial [Gammaproteobacteria bacterium]
MGPIVNIAGYKFVSLTDLVTLRQRLQQQCANLGIRGTILLSEEGINIMLAGSKNAITTFMTVLTHEKKFADIVFKESYSEKIPFQRLQVKIKKEI